MPSSITLTVSHLPTSTSFFLTVLQPLNYIYRGYACSTTIGFGPKDTSIPPDFWLTQATPSVPAGAAHVAFPASSREAVQQFFRLALKAGVSVHGEPSVRDSHGYYSAAIIDFDGNSIEAVYRPTSTYDSNKENVPAKTCTVVSRRIPGNGPSVVSQAPSTSTRAPPPTNLRPDSRQGDAFDALLTRATNATTTAKTFVDSFRPTSSPNKDNATATSNSSNNAALTALLAATAGAALTYALTSRKSSPSPTRSDATHDKPHRRHHHHHHHHHHHRTDHDSDSDRRRRPSVVRSYTTPLPRHHTAQEDGVTKITLLDNDADRHSHGDKSQNDTHAKAAHERRGRRGSNASISASVIDSAATAKPRTQHKMRMIEAPPSAYRGPPGVDDEQRHRARSRSGTRSAAPVTKPTQSQTDTNDKEVKPRRSRSHRRTDSGYAESSAHIAPSRTGTEGFQTVLHVTTHQAYGPHHQHQASTKASGTSKRERSSRTNAETSESRTSRSDRIDAPGKRSTSKQRSLASQGAAEISMPELLPFPPSRAGTWAGSTGGSTVKAGGRGPSGTVIGRTRSEKRLEQSERRWDGSGTVVGVRKGEVRPDDSVSQVG